MKHPSVLLIHADDGKKFYAAVMKRLLKLPAYRLSDLCEEAGVDFSTAWRWQNGSKPEIATVNAVEKAFVKFEKTK